jgi:signal transduction histidine kinase
VRFRTWWVAAVGLASLLLLIVYSVWTASDNAQDIYTRLDQLNSHHREVETKLRRLRSDVHLSGIFVRDYLLDTERAHAQEYQDQLATFRRANLATLAELRALAGEEHTDRIAKLQSQLDAYWRTFEPLIDWTIAEKIMLSARFLRTEVIPRREAVLEIAEEIEALNNANLVAQGNEVTRQQAEFRNELYGLLWRTLVLGVIVALTAVIRLRVLERRSEEQKLIAQNAERHLRELSQQLVATQEEERRKLSRELHDHVGQMLTALRMELGRVDRISAGNSRLASAVSECRQLVDEMVRTVRDLALGLRPSMLDYIGLQAALEWQARDFSRRYGVPVDLEVRGDLDALTDQHRTCVYRVVQEALTNCIRHAHARQVGIELNAGRERLELSVTDDGIGVDSAARPSTSLGATREGLGLRGIEERVRELGGTVVMRSATGQGSTLTIELPLVSAEVALARAAG